MTQGFTVKTTVNFPSGFLGDFAGSTVPDGWLECDGSAVSRTTYSTLFSAIGTTWGVGDGSSTFNLPDLRGIFTRGDGTNGTLSDANGSGFSGTLGSYQNDKIQGHWHSMGITNDSGKRLVSTIGTGGSHSGYSANIGGLATAQEIYTWVPYTDGTNGTPRTGTETNPANATVKKMIKT